MFVAHTVLYYYLKFGHFLLMQVVTSPAPQRREEKAFLIGPCTIQNVVVGPFVGMVAASEGTTHTL